MESGGADEQEALRGLLSDYNRERGPNRFPIDVRFGQQQYVYLTVTVGRDPTYREAIVKKTIKEALGVTGDEGNGVDSSKGLFSLVRRQFGQPEYATRIQGVIQNVEGVVWVTVDDFCLLNSVKDSHGIVSCNSEQVLSLNSQHFHDVFSVVDATEVPAHG
jgi:hypothetical protein